MRHIIYPKPGEIHYDGTVNEIRMTGTYLTKTFFAMGTANSVTLAEKHRTAAEEIKTDTLRLHDLLNVYDSCSEISRINDGAGAIETAISDDTFRLLEDAVTLRKETGGAFDPFMLPAVRLWRQAGQRGKLPDQNDLQTARSIIAESRLVLDRDKHTAYLAGAGQGIDLGGIAKGYAADRANDILAAHGVDNALINYGGTVIVRGAERNVGIQDPFSPTGSVMGSVAVSDRAVVTSGLYERYFELDGRRYHHIIDPRTCMPSESELAGVTLIGRSAERLDALATAVFVLGAREGYELVAREDIEAVFIDKSGNITATNGLRNKLILR